MRITRYTAEMGDVQRTGLLLDLLGRDELYSLLPNRHCKIIHHMSYLCFSFVHVSGGVGVRETGLMQYFSMTAYRFSFFLYTF